MADLQTIKDVVEAGYNMPDASADPGLWKHAMKGRLWTRVEFRGIKQKDVINDLCTRTLDKLEEISALGEVDQAFQILDNLISARDAIRFASLPSKKMTPAPEPKRPIYDAVQRWLMASYKEHLPKDGALTIVRGWMSAARLYDESLTEPVRLANVTMQAENYAFNRDGKYIQHFASTSPEGHALWLHIHAAGAAHVHPVPLNERAGVLLAAIGMSETLFKYTGTAHAAMLKFDAFLPGVGLIPDTDAATIVSEEYMQTDTKRNSDLNEWFPRDLEVPDDVIDGLPGGPIAEELEFYVPAETQTKPQRNYKSLWPTLNNLYALYVTPVGREPREYIHFLLGEVESLNDIPAEVSDNQIVANLKAALDQRHQLKSKSGLEGPSTETKGTQEPMSAIESAAPPSGAVQSALPEAAFVVLFSLYTPGGVEMKYTVRANSGEELDRQVEEYIKRKLAANWTTQRQPSTAPMQNAQTGGTTAPAPTAPPAQTNGSKPILTEQVVKIEREFDKDKKVSYTGLYTLFGGAQGKFATYKIKDTDVAHLATLQQVTGKDWKAEALGTEMGVNLTAHYTESDNKNKAGKPYPDLVKLTA